eukprot:643532-Karenia_brevis.AAC.1
MHRHRAFLPGQPRHGSPQDSEHRRARALQWRWQADHGILRPNLGFAGIDSKTRGSKLFGDYGVSFSCYVVRDHNHHIIK